MDESTPAPLSALARRQDFVAGNVTVRPSMRAIEGPASSVTIEPRVMQVLLALHDAQGAVLSRDDLMQQCWAGAVVGDDAVNRTISEIRRALRDIGASFSIETIPRIGYRLDLPYESGSPDSDLPNPFRGAIDRRKLIAGGVALTGLLAGGATFLAGQRRGARVDALIEKGRQA